MSAPESPTEERALLDALAKLPAIEPPVDQRERFRNRAEAGRASFVDPRRWVPWALAASLLLVIGTGWWIDHQHQRAEIIAARTELTTALTDLSAATRLQAVRTAGGSDVRDKGIVETLTQALLNDPSTNVRVAAAEALAQIADPAALSQAAKKSIEKGGSPFVHAALIDAAGKLTRSMRDQLLSLLLARADLDPVLRVRAEASRKS